MATSDGPEQADAAPDPWGPSGEDPAAPIERLALRLLAAREHSRLELARKLRARGFESSLADLVLERLARSGALDEARLVAHYVAERVSKGFGPLRIHAELREKGLPDALIEPQLKAMEGEWSERLAAAHDRRFGASPPSDRADYARRGRFLEQRGFPSDMIRRHLSWSD